MTEKTLLMSRYLDLKGRLLEVPVAWNVTDMADGTVLITMPSGWAIRGVARLFVRRNSAASTDDSVTGAQ